METLNLSKYNVLEIDSRKASDINGGWFFFLPVMNLFLPSVAEAETKAVQGAYERGYDEAQNNCECN